MGNEQKTHSIRNFLIKYNIMIFVVVLVGLLSLCILILDQTLTQDYESSISDNNIDKTQTSFDAQTTSQILKLNPSTTNPTDRPLPSGRISPFSE